MEKFSHELEKLRGTILRPIIVFCLVALALLILTPKDIIINGYSLPILWFGTPSLATEIFLSAKAFLVPPDVPLVVLGPVSAFVAPMIMAFLVSLLATFPYILYSFLHFIIPALYKKERKNLYIIVLPSLALFYLGCSLAYFIIIPQTFSILYAFASPIGVTPFFSLDAFISSVFLLTITVGLIFLLPVIMVMLTRLSIVPQKFWLKHWRGAILISLIFSALFTPDGSGVTMAFLFIPLIVLYGVGIVLSRKGSIQNLEKTV